jgi:hypothetical protein
MNPGDPYIPNGKRVVFSLRVTSEDLDSLRFIFEQINPENEAKPLARRAMKQVKKCAGKLGFKWVA